MLNMDLVMLKGMEREDFIQMEICQELKNANPGTAASEP